jgi:nijmegen breakage syndrome protein 1
VSIDCTIIIQTDRTVSRLHAEIKLDLINKPGNSTKCPQETITLKDLSKFGSFVNRTVGSKPVFSLPDKEISLNDGDLLTFGTDSSSFRYSKEAQYQGSACSIQY